MKQLITIVFIACLATSCRDKDDPEVTRPFHMGFTPFPYDISGEAVVYSYQKLTSDGDIINHHFDDGVPWQAALTGAPFHANIESDWLYRKSSTPSTHKIYLSVTPINFLRTGLAALRDSAVNQELPEPWNSYRFNHMEVKTAYLNYCKRIIDYFEPDYFAMGIEVNLLHVANPALWTDYMELHQYVYEDLKTTYPALPIFSSQVGLYALDGFFDDTDETEELAAIQQVMQYSDYLGLSIYPYLTKYLGNEIPANTLDQLFELSSKPVAITETGYAAQNFSIDLAPGFTVSIESDPTKQNEYLQSMLEAATNHKLEFVINFVIRDYDELWLDLGSPTDINIAWRDTGLYDGTGQARTALTTWKNYLTRRYVP